MDDPIGQTFHLQTFSHRQDVPFENEQEVERLIQETLHEMQSKGTILQKTSVNSLNEDGTASSPTHRNNN